MNWYWLKTLWNRPNRLCRTLKMIWQLLRILWQLLRKLWRPQRMLLRHARTHHKMISSLAALSRLKSLNKEKLCGLPTKDISSSYRPMETLCNMTHKPTQLHGLPTPLVKELPPTRLSAKLMAMSSFTTRATLPCGAPVLPLVMSSHLIVHSLFSLMVMSSSMTRTAKQWSLHGQRISERNHSKTSNKV